MRIDNVANRLIAWILVTSRDWYRDRRGNVTILYAFAMLPTIALMGLGTDWYQQQAYKTRLDAAADSAAIAAITTAQAYINTHSATQSNATANAIAAGQAQAVKVFAVNSGSTQSRIPVTPTITFSPVVNQTLTASVTYSGAMPTNFGRLVGAPTFPISGKATSSLTMGKYIDFYLLLDVSGSMGIPTTTAGQTALAQKNPDNLSTYPTGCVFACHYAGSQGYTIARANNIALRVDTVGQAVTALLQTANQTKTLLNQYRVGLYPFIVHAIDAAPLSSDFTLATSVSSTLGSNYLDQGTQGQTSSTGVQIGSGGTHFEYIQNDMIGYLRNFGDGSSASAPKPFIFIVTDGVDNNQFYPFNGSQPQIPNLNFCNTARGNNPPFTVAVLYIPYVPISNPNPSFAGDEDDRVNSLIPSIPPALQACASPGFFFTASTPADINNAMQTMFFQALQAARLTQ